MVLPLIQGRVGAFATLSSGISQSKSSPPVISSPFKNVPAATVKISEEARALYAKSANSTQSIEPVAPQKSQLDSVIDYIGKVAQRVGEIDSELLGGTLKDDQKAAYLTEKESLAQELQRVTTSNDFKKFAETLDGIQSSLSSGTSPNDLQRILQSSVSALGSGVLALVGSGNANGISKISSIVSTLSQNAYEDIFSGNSSKVVAQVTEAKKLLSGVVGTTVKNTENEVQITSREVILPEQQEIQFVSGEKYALSLKGYSSKGLLTAASAGLDLTKDDISALTLSVPKPSDSDDDDELNNSEIESSRNEISVTNQL